MPKLDNVTNEEIDSLIRDLEDCLSQAHDLSHRMTSGYCEEIEDPAAKAKSLTFAARDLSDLAGKALLRASMDETRRKTERLLKQQAAAE